MSIPDAVAQRQAGRRRWLQAGLLLPAVHHQALAQSAPTIPTDPRPVLNDSDALPGDPKWLQRWRAGIASRQGGSDTGTESPERTRLITTAETSLSRLQIQSAIDHFEQAAAIRHSADAEGGLVRCWLQAGEFRRALAFVAHTAAHRETGAGAALYAWMLRAGGYQTQSRELLTQALSRFPSDRLLLEANRALSTSTPRAEGVLLEPPWRLAPYAEPIGKSAAIRLIATGLLTDGGRQVLLPKFDIAGRQLWVRTALGRTSPLRTESAGHSKSFQLLSLRRPISVRASPALSQRTPFPGSPAYLVAYVPDAQSRATWPLLQAGVLGQARSLVDRDLGMEPGFAAPGAAVFDKAGGFVGIAQPALQGRHQFVSLVEPLREHGRSEWADPAKGAVSIDQVYERALESVVQVLAVSARA